VNSIDEFVRLLREEIGLAVTADDVALAFDDLPGWDSLHLLTLLTVLERETGRRISLPSLLESPSLAHVYTLVGGAS
jgi:acyl carrier protein